MGVQTTVVFTDLIGSTGAFEALGNAKATQAVTELTGWIGDVCASYGGRVVKNLGDGVLAVFPMSPDAISAVVEMQRVHQKRIASTDTELRMPIRIGVATGDVEMVSGDCYGDAVNVASRLSDLTGADQIWSNDAAIVGARESDGVRFRLLGPITIRGRAEPCTVYQVDWREDEASDFLTMQGEVDATVHAELMDALGGQITLGYLEKRKDFKSFDLPANIGRVQTVEFHVNDPRVSRNHARVDWRNGGFVLTDLSSYGTWVRFAGSGNEVFLRREECVLHGRGELALGAPFTDPTAPTVTFSVL
jgi:class 3 adenylate cyclase